MKVTGKKEKNSAYYDGIYKKSKTYNQSWTKSRYINLWKKIIEELIKQGENPKIIDCGCGTGQLLAMLKHYNFKAVGFDYSKAAIEIAQQIFPDIECFVGDLFKVNYSGYDVAILTEVMEHIELDETVIKTVSESVNTVIISVPSFDDPAHVRYFDSTGDVGNRYGKYFKEYTVEKIGPWFLFVGRK